MNKKIIFGIALLILVLGGGFFVLLKEEGSISALVTSSSDPVPFGDGTLKTYVTVMENDENTKIPIAVGVEFSDDAFYGLTDEPTDGKWCATQDGETRCLIGHGTVLQFPDEISITPIKWMLLSWNPNGHIPPGVYDIPHFDFHFYVMEEEKRNEIKPGLCEDADPGVTIDCESFKKGMIPLPPNFVPLDYINSGGVEAGMGNHLIDPTSSEFETDFTHTWIYGFYDGEITFLEPMISREFILDKPNLCVDIKQPEAFKDEGWYPTQYCMRYKEDLNTYTVSIEAFAKHEATQAEQVIVPTPNN